MPPFFRSLKNSRVAITSIAVGVPLVVALALLYPLSHAQSKAEEKPDGKASAQATKPVLAVQAVSPSESQLARRISANGNISPWQEATIGAEVNGLRVTQVLVNIGDIVRKGQVLAVFSSETLEAELQQARATLAENEAALAEATANAQRALSLKDTGALSEQQIAQFATAEKTALARLASTQAQVNAAQIRLRNKQLVSPDAGMVSARKVTVGSVVSGDSELFRLIRQGRLEWRAEVTASEIGKIKLGSVANITAASGAQVQGKVRMVAPTVDPQTRNALIYVDMPQHPEVIAGMFAKGEFILGSAPALTLPQQALVLRDGFTYAARIEKDSRISMIKLQTGRRAGDLVEIVQGIHSSERFVAVGVAFLADGDTVRIHTASSPAVAKRELL